MTGRVDIDWNGTTVEQAANAGSYKSLRKAAAYLWRVAKNSIRHDGSLVRGEVFVNSFGRYQRAYFWKRTSKPGQPPVDHSGWKKTFAFDVDRDSMTAVIGPKGGMKDVSNLLEFGGTAKAKWTETDFHGERHSFSREVEYKARPTMWPALERSRGKIAEFWKGCIN